MEISKIQPQSMCRTNDRESLFQPLKQRKYTRIYLFVNILKHRSFLFIFK